MAVKKIVITEDDGKQTTLTETADYLLIYHGTDSVIMLSNIGVVNLFHYYLIVRDRLAGVLSFGKVLRAKKRDC